MRRPRNRVSIRRRVRWPKPRYALQVHANGGGGAKHWLTHFKLSGVALVGSCAVSWFAFPQLLRWLVDPLLQPWRARSALVHLHFGSVDELWKTKLMVATIFGLLALSPALASDVWGLLKPRMTARAARLRIVFALSSCLVAVLTLLLTRHLAPDVFAFLAPPTWIEL